ncbi:MAG TPA: cytidylate kinase-like family protein [Verrucomicrobiae bacterium]|jgi:cytidylate kinase
MKVSSGFDQCRAFIDAHARAGQKARAAHLDSVKCVTISRQSGCGAHAFAEHLAEWLQVHLPSAPAPWTIFDGDLVEAVLRDHHLPARLAAFMPEDKVPQINDIVENVLSLHPPTELLVRHTAETILRLAELGNVILLGRGSTIITAQLPGVLHVRLIGSLKQRVAHMQQFDKITEREALARIKREDGGRARYLRRYFRADIADPLHYHLVINTDCIALAAAAELVGGLALRPPGFTAASSIKAAA